MTPSKDPAAVAELFGGSATPVLVTNTPESVTPDEREAVRAELRAAGNKAPVTTDMLNALALKVRQEKQLRDNKEIRDQSDFALRQTEAVARIDKEKAEKEANKPANKASNAVAEDTLKAAYAARDGLQEKLLQFDQYEAANNAKISAKLPTLGGVFQSSAANVLAQAGTKGALEFVQNTKGSISDGEMKLFKAASISEDNYRVVNQSLINAGRAAAIRQAQLASFLDSWQGDAAEGIKRFKEFADKNHIVKADKDGNIAMLKTVQDVTKDKEYMNYLDPTYVQPEETSNVNADGTPALSDAARNLQSDFPSLKKGR
jgi:hypothetical protein